MHLVPLGISHASLWHDQGVVLIDTGLPGSGPAIRAALDDLGFSA